MAPNEDEFLLLPPGMMPAVREKDLKELFRRTPAVFPKTKLSDLIAGQMCYCTFKVSNTLWSYLAVVEKVEGDDICFRVADNREFLQTGESEVPLNTQSISEDSDVYLVQAVPPSASRPLPPLAVSTADVTRALGSVARWKRMLAEDNGPTKWQFRASVVTAAVLKLCRMVEVENLDETVKTTLAEEFNFAKDAVEQKNSEEDRPEITMGQEGANVDTIRDVLKKLREKPDRGTQSDSGTIARLANDVADLKTMMKKLVVDGAVAAAASTESTKAKGGETSCAPNGECCYEAAGASLHVQKGGDPNKIGKERAPMVKEAKKSIVTNVLAINKELSDNWSLSPDAEGREEEAQQVWKELLGKTSEEVLDEVLVGKKWGGQVELAAALWHTETEVVVLHAESIHAKADDATVNAGIYNAMLTGLPSGPAKKKRVFVVLNKSHYRFGHVEKAGQKFYIFDIGREADEAQALIVDFLKSQNKGPLKSLDSADQAEKIAKAFEERHEAEKSNAKVTYASKVGRGRGRESKPAQSNRSRSSSRGSDKARSRSRSRARSRSRSRTRARSPKPKPAKCRNYSAAGTCRYGSKCLFEHVGESSSSRRKAAEPEWQVAGKKKRKKKKQAEATQVALKVHSKFDVHPGHWRSKLKKFDPKTHQLTRWVSREGSWFLLAAEPDHHEELLGRITALRKAGLTVELLSKEDEESDDEEGEDEICADHLAGRKCKHDAPYCK